MRVALARASYAAAGGAEQHARRLARELVRRGWAVDLIAARWPAEDQGVRVRQLALPPAGAAVRTLAFALMAPAVARDGACDCLYSLERLWAQDVFRAGDGCHRAYLAVRRAVGGRWRRMGDTLAPLHRVVTWLERRIFAGRGARRVVVNARRVAEEAERHYGMPIGRALLIRNGVDLDRFHPRHREALRPGWRAANGLQDSELTVLFAGSGFFRKGLGPLIHALARVRRRMPATLVVVGQGKAGSYRQLADGLGVRGAVRFAGPTERPEVAYAGADLLALPALYEPSANVCLEAMAMGMPVVTSEVNGAGEILSNGRAGYVLKDPTDADALAEHLLALADPDVRREMGQAARAVAEEFPWARHVDAVEALLAEVAAAR